MEIYTRKKYIQISSIMPIVTIDIPLKSMPLKNSPHKLPILHLFHLSESRPASTLMKAAY